MTAGIRTTTKMTKIIPIVCRVCRLARASDSWYGCDDASAIAAAVFINLESTNGYMYTNGVVICIVPFATGA